MKKGDTYENFGCTWIVDDIYTVSEELIKEFELVYTQRIKAHVIKAPIGYEGIREIDAAYRK